MMQHFDLDSLLVAEGQSVVRGQVLAVTGLTGWVGPIPHLHLSMLNRYKRPAQSLPYRFRNFDGKLDDNVVDLTLYFSGWDIARTILTARREAEDYM